MVKNKILKTLVGVNVLMFIFGGCMLDSSSWVPLAIAGVSLGFLGLFAYANS
jgi:hypothetical protein